MKVLETNIPKNIQKLSFKIAQKRFKSSTIIERFLYIVITPATHEEEIVNALKCTNRYFIVILGQPLVCTISFKDNKIIWKDEPQFKKLQIILESTLLQSL